MKTKEERIEELRAKQEKELKNMEKELSIEIPITENLPGNPDNWRVTVLDRALYGMDAWIHRRSHHYDTEYRGAEKVSAEDFLQAIDLMPPLPAVKARMEASIPSFMPEQYAIEHQNYEPGRGNLEIADSIDPIFFEAEPASYKQTVTILWFAKVADTQVGIHYELPWDFRWMKSAWEKSGGKNLGIYWKRPQNKPGTELILPGMPRLKTVDWWNSPESPGKTTLYWRREEAGISNIIEAVAKAMKGETI